MKNVISLEPGTYYHIFNRAVGSEKLFLKDQDYGQFLYKWREYVMPMVTVYAFCLMPNHFHFLVRMKSEDELVKILKNNSKPLDLLISRQFARFFSSYALSFNCRYRRKGKLFMLPFKRKKVKSEDYFTILVYYIHRNPLHHGLEIDVNGWEYSSYRDLTDKGPTWLQRNDVHEWFGGRQAFVDYHRYLDLRSMMLDDV